MGGRTSRRDPSSLVFAHEFQKVLTGPPFSYLPWSLSLVGATAHATVHDHPVLLLYLRLQWEFRPCGKGFIISSIHSSGSFLMVQDLKGLHLEGSAQVVTGTFPTCWEVEVMDDRNAPGPVDEPGDTFARYVSWRDLAGFKVRPGLVPRRDARMADLT